MLIASGTSHGHPPGSRKTPLVLRSATERRPIYEGVLRKEGYPVETVAQLQEAARNGHRAGVRWAALYLIAGRVGQGGIPAFKEALKDSDFDTRMTAALLLGAFGDTSGVEVLRRDVRTLAPRNGEPDPNMMQLEGKELERAKSRRYGQLFDAIQAAEALSQLADATGLELAAHLALQGEYSTLRMHAVSTLTNLVILAASNDSILAGQTIDPESVLILIAESETNPAVLGTVKGYAAKLPREKSRKIYEKLVASPHLEEKDRETVREILKMYERQAKRQSKDRSAEVKRK